MDFITKCIASVRLSVVDAINRLKLPGGLEIPDRVFCVNDYPRNETIPEPFFQWTVEPYRRTLANGSLTGEFNTPGSSM